MWLRVTNPKSNWDLLSLDGIDYMAHITRATKTAMSPKLDSCPAADLTIATTKGDKNASHAVELDEEEDLASILRRFEVESHPTIQAAFAREIHLIRHVPTGK